MAQANAHPQYAPDDALRKHYDDLRQTRGWSWATLAEYFESQWTDPSSPHLAAWARTQAEATPAKRGKAKAVETR